jgi:predicted translin family RNA/ssDNA-binding protein
MINRRAFDLLRKELKKSYDERNAAIIKSRELVVLSKKIIYAVQRSDLNNAGRLIKKIKSKKREVDRFEKSDASAHRIAMQEFVEAACFYEFVKRRRLLTPKDLGVDAENYLLGVCDLTGELVRKAINAAIKGNYYESINIKNFVSELYGELMQFDFRNSELRKKFDGIKYDLKKLEDLALQLKLKKK